MKKLGHRSFKLNLPSKKFTLKVYFFIELIGEIEVNREKKERTKFLENTLILQ